MSWLLPDQIQNFKQNQKPNGLETCNLNSLSFQLYALNCKHFQQSWGKSNVIRFIVNLNLTEILMVYLVIWYGRRGWLDAFGLIKYTLGSFIHYVRKIFWKTNIYVPVWNVSFSKNLSTC